MRILLLSTLLLLFAATSVHAQDAKTDSAITLAPTTLAAMAPTLSCEDQSIYLRQLVATMNARITQLESQVAAQRQPDLADQTQKLIDSLNQSTESLAKKYNQPGCAILLNGTFRCAPAGDAAMRPPGGK